MASRGFTDSQIEAFSWIMKTESATEAAGKMLISQPAVSRLIKQLEDRLGFDLFERHNNRLLPTRKGILFYDEVEKVYVGLNHLRSFAEKLRDREVGQYRIVSMPSFSTSLVPDTVTQLTQTFPDLEISLYSYRSSQIIEDMIAQRFDFGITTDLAQDPRYQSFQYSLPAVGLIPVSHPLANKQIIDVEDFNNETLICGEPGEQSRTLINQCLTENAVNPKKILTTSLGDMAIRLVENGSGLSVINALSASDTKLTGLVARPLSFDIKYEFQIILPLEKNIESAVNNVNIELVRLVGERINQAKRFFSF